MLGRLKPWRIGTAKAVDWWHFRSRGELCLPRLWLCRGAAGWKVGFVKAMCCSERQSSGWMGMLKQWMVRIVAKGSVMQTQTEWGGITEAVDRQNFWGKMMLRLLR